MKFLRAVTQIFDRPADKRKYIVFLRDEFAATNYDEKTKILQTCGNGKTTTEVSTDENRRKSLFYDITVAV